MTKSKKPTSYQISLKDKEKTQSKPRCKQNFFNGQNE